MTSIDFAKRPGGFNNYKRKTPIIDRRFIPRVKEYVEVCQSQPTVEEVVDYLQDSFPEYARKKRAALRQYLAKVLNTTDILSYGRCADRTSELENNYMAKRQKRSKSLEQQDDGEVSNESDISVNDEELVDYKDTNIINNSMQNLYKTAAVNKEKAGNAKPAPVIDLTGNCTQTNCEPTPALNSPRRTDVHIIPEANITSPRSVHASPRRHETITRNSIPTSPQQQVLQIINRTSVPSSPRGGLQVFAKTNHMTDIRTKSKINIHSSFLQEENEQSQNDETYINERSQSNEIYTEKTNRNSICDDENSSKSLVVADDKTNLKSIVVATSSALHNTEGNVPIVNKNLISISEDERNIPSRPSTPLSRPSTPSSKAKAHRQKSDIPKESKKRFEPTVSNKTFKDIGGYDSCIQEVSKLLFHLKHPEIFQKIGIKPPRGFLLHGPPGCGKTLLANAIAGELGIPFFKIAATEVVSGISGDSEQRIRSLFAEAVAVAPSILFIDEIDSITPKRENAGKEMERRVVTQILTCMDELDDCHSHVLVIGATNRPDSLDPALRRAGRFDREIAMGIPDRTARKTILQVICCNLRLSPDFDFERIAVKTPGYVGADIEALTREAAMCAVDSAFKLLEERNATTSRLPDFTITTPATKTYGETTNFKETNTTAWLRQQPPLSEEQLSALYISTEHFESALPHVQPSAKREGFATVPDVTWDDIGALEDIREELTMAIMAPVQNPDEFESLGLMTPPGILLCGPPGCGKTLLAKAVANEAGINFISVKGPELMNMYVGESEKAVRQVFQRARSSSPCVIFFDEIDALCPKRSHGDSNVSSRVVNQLLTEMDGLESRKNVFIMGATNRPDILDGAILRPGRMDKQLYVGLPNSTDRAKILRALTKNGTKPTFGEDISIEELACHPECEGFSGADVGALVREASVSALKEFMRMRNGKIDNDEEKEEDDQFTKVSSDELHGTGELVKTIVVTCPSACDENSTSSISSHLEDVIYDNKTNTAEINDVLSSDNPEKIPSTCDEIHDATRNHDVSVDDVKVQKENSMDVVEECTNPTDNAPQQSPKPPDFTENPKSDIEVLNTESSSINEKLVTSETVIELDTISLNTNSPATADFHVGSVEENELPIIIDTSSELTTEDVEEAIPSYLDVHVEDVNANQVSSDDVVHHTTIHSVPFHNTSTTRVKKIVVSKKHFLLAFKNVQPSVSEKDRIWYEKMKSKNR